MSLAKPQVSAVSDFDFEFDFAHEHMNGSEALGYLTFVRTYAQSGETYEDTIRRYLKFFATKYPNLRGKINSYGHALLQKKAVGSMRMLQFAGEPVDRDNARAYNCSFTGISSVKDFGDVLYLLCCGCGVGISVQYDYINQLPIVSKGHEDLFEIPDSKEGWGDSVQKLILNPNQQFDYSKIRPVGSPLSTGGFASGPEPLIQSHDDIRKILKGKIGERLSPTDVADIVCLIARCVVAGGVRRSSIIVLFEDDEMLNFKNFDKWWETHEHRSIANVSRVVKRGTKLVEETIDKALNSLSGEPGIMLVNESDINENIGSNPCQPAFAKVFEKTKGLCTFADIDAGSEIWDGKKFVKVLKKWSTGIKSVYEYSTTKGSFVGTDNHPVMSKGMKLEVKDAKEIDTSAVICNQEVKFDPKIVLDGILFGDGFTHKASNSLPLLLIGQNDYDYLDSEVKHLIGRSRSGANKCAYEVNYISEEIFEAIDKFKTYERVIPETIMNSDVNTIRSFLRGLFTANGCVTAGRVQFKTSSKVQAKQIQLLLSIIGIGCSFVTNKPSKIKWDNGEYTSKESYNLILYGYGEKFIKEVGFLQKYKMQKEIKDSVVKSSSAKIVNTEYLGEHEVFDITVDSDEHLYWTNNCIVHNCGEISLKNKAFCNLCEIIMHNCEDKEDFFYACKAASFFGTLQASLTNFNYISPEWSENAKKEGLLGVSLTGQAMAQHLCEPEILREGARLVKQVNIETAKLLGINPAKRLTTTKPSGSTSCVFGSSSGIHAAYSEYCIRRIRVSKNSDLGKKLMQLKKDLYCNSASILQGNAKYNFIVDDNTHDRRNLVLQFPVKYENAIYRKDESAVDLLERVKSVYQNWVVPGHNEGQETNNVSVTVFFKPDEKEAVKQWMIENQGSYRGISVLPYDCGTYTLTPFEEVDENEWKMYEKNFPAMDWVEFSTGIKSIKTSSTACAGGACEIGSL